MSVKHSLAKCDWCGRKIEDGESVACRPCHEELEQLEQKVVDLKAEIESMQQAVAEQGMKLIDVTGAESSLKFVID